MSKHNSIYNILGKLSSLEPKQESILKTLNESKEPNPLSLADRLNNRFAEFKEGKGSKPDFLDVDKDGNKKEPMKKAVADKKKNPFAKKVSESEVDEDMLTPKEKKFAKLAPPKDKITYADKIVGAKKTDEGEYQDAPNKSNIPAAQRKAKAAPGDQSWKLSTQDLDDEQSKSPTSSAGLAKAKARLGMNEGGVDHTSVAANLGKLAKVIRSVQTPEQFAVAQKYARRMSGTIMKHQHDKMGFGSGLRANLGVMRAIEADLKAKAAELGIDFQPLEEGEKVATKTGYIHKGTYGSDAYDSDNEDDYDEWGNEKKGAKKAASSDAPKKRGRPAKAKGPERVTSKAWKHKGGRVSETKINIATFVEDTMAELDSILVTEKAVSKAQQKFMGMVHAAQTGDKAASPEVAKVAKSMGKQDAEDFASTKHKGLPQHVKESVQLTEGLAAIKHRYGKEVNGFVTSGVMDPDLYHALHDHYYDEMPAGVKRGSNTQEWVADKFMVDTGHTTRIDSSMDHALPETDGMLDELARLAGLGRTGHHGACNHTPEGVECPEHGIMECGSLWESEEKPDYLDVDKDGDEEESFKKALSDKEDKDQVEECDMSPLSNVGGAAQSESGMSVNTSMDTKTGRKSVTVTADGEAAEQLAAMLKMAGLGGAAGAHAEPEAEEHATIVIADPAGHDEEQEVEEEYANDPHEEYVDTDVITSQGQDLNRPKKQYQHSYKQGDNPMAMQENALEGRLASLYNSLKVARK